MGVRLPAGLTFKDLVTIFISLVAVSMSAYTFYRANYYINDSANVRTLSNNFCDSSEEYRGNRITVPVIFINHGNRDLMVLELTMDIFPTDGGRGLRSRPEGNEVPVVLKPKDIKLINIHLLVEDLSRHVDETMTLNIQTMNSDGDDARDRIDVGRTKETMVEGRRCVGVSIDGIDETLFGEDSGR